MRNTRYPGGGRNMLLQRIANGKPANVVNRNQVARKIIQYPSRAGAGRSNTGAPAFPGANSGLNIQQMRNFNQQQPRVTGVNFTAGAGTTTIQNINLPGDAKMFLGVMFTPTTDVSDTFNIAINNNKFIDNASVFLHSPDNSQSINSQFFPYMQPLSGKDSFDIDIISIAGLTGIVQLHYI